MRYFLFIYLLCAACSSSTNFQETTNQPNVLILYSDDQSWNTIGALGNDAIQTPNLDRLVKMGTSFTRAHVVGGNHGAICAFSRAMLMTGRPFWNIPASFANPTTGECPFPTMPEVFKDHGYQTYFTGKWHNKPPELVAGFDQGKNIFLGGMHFPKEGGHFNPKLYNEIDTTAVFPATNKIQRDEFSSKLYADATIDFIRQKKEGEPFFIYTAFTSPHDPRTPPPPFEELYDPEAIQLPPNFMEEHPFDMGIRTMRDEALLPYPRTVAAVKKEIALYYGMISELDAQIGRILDALEEKGLLETTVIVFAGDNGLAVGQHGLLGKQNLYDHSVRVPLIMAGPGIPAGQKANTLSAIHDIYPTLSTLCGIKKSETIQGVDLSPAFKSPDVQLRKELLLAYTKTQRALRTMEDQKIILTKYKGQSQEQIFDLTKDPWELNNLAGNTALQKENVVLRAKIQEQLLLEEDTYYQPQVFVTYKGIGSATKVTMPSIGEGLEIRYTLDGSMPNAQSKIAGTSIEVFEKKMLHAQTFFKGETVSPVVTHEIGSPDKFSGFQLERPPNKKYDAQGPLTLMDGLRGGPNFSDQKWLGFHEQDAVIEVDLGSVKNISSVHIGYLSDPGSWIFPPTEIIVETTRNREQYIPACNWRESVSEGVLTKVGKVSLDCPGVSTRLLKIIVKNIGQCPEWHDGSGKKAWLFIDEIWVE